MFAVWQCAFVYVRACQNSDESHQLFSNHPKQLSRMELSKLSINKLRTELWTCHIASEQRCLRKACEWTEDLLYSLTEEGEEKLLSKLDKDFNDVTTDFDPFFEQAKACFELQEFDRAAHIIRNRLHDDKIRFLYYFARYKAAEKKRIDLSSEVSAIIPKKAQIKYDELKDSIERSMEEREPDGWLLYVYGLVLHKFRHRKNAIHVIVKAINLTPVNWSAWYMLTTLITNKDQLYSLPLPNHLFKVFFYYMMRLDLDIPHSEAWIFFGAKEMKTFLDKYFKGSLFIKTLTAKSSGYQLSNYKEALEIFNQIRNEDPYRIDAMEVFSNLLYVRKMRQELAKLAYDIERVDPLTSEANSCIANSYSAREQHTKAILYFTRALRLNPDHLNSWTLIGHEYLEMKNMDKALQAYLYAISINKRDCRAWIGLGNTIETLMSGPNVSSPSYERCLYYYSQVSKYRPKDHIMFIAMGSVFEKMGEMNMAINCVKRAGQEGLCKLAKLYEIKGMRKEADEAYQKWLKYAESVKGNDSMEQSDSQVNSLGQSLTKACVSNWYPVAQL